jgi:hypothetical protein
MESENPAQGNPQRESAGGAFGIIAQLETTHEDKFGVERDDLMEQQEEERQAGLQDGPISASFN